MTSLWNIATPVACVAVICGAAILWWVHKGKATERKKLVDAVTAYHARAEKRDGKLNTVSPTCITRAREWPRTTVRPSAGARMAADQGYAKAQAALGIGITVILAKQRQAESQEPSRQV
jgi:hypothetical protein